MHIVVALDSPPAQEEQAQQLPSLMDMGHRHAGGKFPFQARPVEDEPLERTLTRHAIAPHSQQGAVSRLAGNQCFSLH